MKKVDYEHFGRFSAPANLRERGGVLYFTQKKADFTSNRYESDLYRLKNGEVRRLTDSKDVGAYWLLDEGIVFSSIREDKDREKAKEGPLTVLRMLPYDGGEACELLRLEMTVTGIRFITPERFVFAALYSHRYEEIKAKNGGDAEKTAKELKEQRDYEVFDELPFWSNGGGVTNKMRARLYSYDHGTVTPVTDEYTSVDILETGENNGKIVFSAVRYTDVAPQNNELFCFDIESGETKNISFGEGLVYEAARFMSGAELCVFASKTQRIGLCQNSDVYMLNTADGKATVLYDKGEYDFYNSVGSDIVASRSIERQIPVAGNKLYTVSTFSDCCHLICIDTESGDITRITSSRGMVREAVFHNGAFAVIAMREGQGPELYEVGIDGTERRLTELNTALCAEYEYSEPREISFVNAGGDRIYGYVIAPTDLKENEKYPTILDIHGGPKTAYGTVYFHEMQLWASMGYAVIYCNPTGSDGRGDAFSDLRGKYGEVDYEDIMAFTDLVIKSFDFIDQDRMGVTGGSYGGFMTNWIIGHTDRFRAAASQRSISNWISFFGLSDIGYYFMKDQTDSDVWTDHDKAWRQSPLRYADRVKTPTLFIHSDEDYRCPAAEGIQMFSALRYFGVDARLCLFHGENHELSRSGKPLHRVRRLREITEWFERYLRK